MKKLLSILSLAILISSCSETKERISIDMVTIVDDVCYLKADMSIVTGIVTEALEDGQLYSESNWKDGKKDGLHRKWYEGGRLIYEENYKDGGHDGLAKRWHSNGQLEEEGNWKDGKRDGLVKQWYENGQLEEEGNWKNGELDGYKSWDEDGQLKSGLNYR